MQQIRSAAMIGAVIVATCILSLVPLVSGKHTRLVDFKKARADAAQNPMNAVRSRTFAAQDSTVDCTATAFKSAWLKMDQACSSPNATNALDGNFTSISEAQPAWNELCSSDCIALASELRSGIYGNCLPQEVSDSITAIFVLCTKDDNQKYCGAVFSVADQVDCTVGAHERNPESACRAIGQCNYTSGVCYPLPSATYLSELCGGGCVVRAVAALASTNGAAGAAVLALQQDTCSSEGDGSYCYSILTNEIDDLVAAETTKGIPTSSVRDICQDGPKRRCTKRVYSARLQRQVRAAENDFYTCVANMYPLFIKQPHYNVTLGYQACIDGFFHQYASTAYVTTSELDKFCSTNAKGEYCIGLMRDFVDGNIVTDSSCLTTVEQCKGKSCACTAKCVTELEGAVKKLGCCLGTLQQVYGTLPDITYIDEHDIPSFTFDPANYNSSVSLGSFTGSSASGNGSASSASTSGSSGSGSSGSFMSGSGSFFSGSGFSGSGFSGSGFSGSGFSGSGFSGSGFSFSGSGSGSSGSSGSGSSTSGSASTGSLSSGAGPSGPGSHHSGSHATSSATSGSSAAASGSGSAALFGGFNPPTSTSRVNLGLFRKFSVCKTSKVLAAVDTTVEQLCPMPVAGAPVSRDMPLGVSLEALNADPSLKQRLVAKLLGDLAAFFGLSADNIHASLTAVASKKSRHMSSMAASTSVTLVMKTQNSSDASAAGSQFDTASAAGTLVLPSTTRMVSKECTACAPGGAAALSGTNLSFLPTAPPTPIPAVPGGTPVPLGTPAPTVRPATPSPTKTSSAAGVALHALAAIAILLSLM